MYLPWFRGPPALTYLLTLIMACIFETERLLVRIFTSDDQRNFFLLNGNADVVRFIRPVKTKEASDQFLLEVIAAASTTPLFGRWAVHEKASREFVGCFAVIPVENTDHMQLGYALLPQHWGKGYATELTRAGLHYIFTQTPLNIIYGYTEEPNAASQKVLLKSGFFIQAKKCRTGKSLWSLF